MSDYENSHEIRLTLFLPLWSSSCSYSGMSHAITEASNSASGSGSIDPTSNLASRKWGLSTRFLLSGSIDVDTAAGAGSAVTQYGQGSVATLISRQAAIQIAMQSRWREQLTQQSNMQISGQEELSESMATSFNRDADIPSTGSAAALAAGVHLGSPVARSGYAQSRYAQIANSGGYGDRCATSGIAVVRAFSSSTPSDETTRMQSIRSEKANLVLPTVRVHDPDLGKRKDSASKVRQSSDEGALELAAVKQNGTGFENTPGAGVSEAALGGVERLATRIGPTRAGSQTDWAIGNKQVAASAATQPSGLSALAVAGDSFAAGSHVLDENHLAVSRALHPSVSLVVPGPSIFPRPGKVSDLATSSAQSSSHASSSGQESGTPAAAASAAPASSDTGLTKSASKAAGATATGVLSKTASSDLEMAIPGSVWDFSSLLSATSGAPDAPVFDGSLGAAGEIGVQTRTASKDESSLNRNTHVTTEIAAERKQNLRLEPVDSLHISGTHNGQTVLAATNPSSIAGLAGRLPTSAAAASLFSLQPTAGAIQSVATPKPMGPILTQAMALPKSESEIGSDRISAETVVPARLPIAGDHPTVSHLAGDQFTPAHNLGGPREGVSSAGKLASALGGATASKSEMSSEIISGVIDTIGRDETVGMYGSNRQMPASPTVALGARQDLMGAASETGRNTNAQVPEDSGANKAINSGSSPSARPAPGVAQMNGLFAQSVDSKAGSGSSKIRVANPFWQGASSSPAHATSVNMHGLTDAAVSQAGSAANSSSVNTNLVTGGSAKLGAARIASADPFEEMDVGGSATRGVTPAGRRELAVGYQDASLGYVELHAHLEGSGVHALLTAQSANASATLEGHLSSLSGWLNDRHTPVERLTVSPGGSSAMGNKDGGAGQRPDGNADASAESRQKGLPSQGSRQSGNGDPAIGITSGLGGSSHLHSLGSGVSSSGSSEIGLFGPDLSKTGAASENVATVSPSGAETTPAGKSSAPAFQTMARAASEEGNSAKPRGGISVVA